MPSKPTTHNIYLLLSAGLILSGVVIGLSGGGQIHLIPGMAGRGQFHFRALKTFTYQSNLLLVVGFITMAMLPKTSKLRHYISVSVMLAATVTGLVYNFLLVPFAQAPMFFSGYVNFSTHVLVTALALANYFIFEEKGHITHRHILAGMIFPGLYWAIFVAIGERINFFPYFFMDPTTIGWLMVLAWFAALLAVFAGLGFMLMLYDKKHNIPLPKSE